MFGDITKELVRQLGGRRELIANKVLIQKFEMLSLVRVKKNKATFWKPVTYELVHQKTLLDLVKTDYIPEYEDEVLVKDFKKMNVSCGSGDASLDLPNSVMNVEASGISDTVDAASPITLNVKTVNVQNLRIACSDKKVEKIMLDNLKTNGKDKLAFIYKKVYNIASVHITDIGTKGGGLMASIKKVLKFEAANVRSRETSFTVPENATFAYGLMELTIDDKGTVGIPLKVMEVGEGRSVLNSDGGDKTLQEVTKVIKRYANLLLPLADLPESCRRDLLKHLYAIMDDSDALSLLEQALDPRSEGVFDLSQSIAVSSFMGLLKDSKASIAQKDAAHLLVGTMSVLPDNIPAMLINRSEELEVLNLMVSSLIQNKPVRLPESLPASLQEAGELRWLAELLCLTDDKLNELRQHWTTPELPVEMLLRLLCHVLQGLSLMQAQTCSQ